MVHIMSFCSLSIISLHYFCCMQLQKLLLLLLLPYLAAVVKFVAEIFQGEEAVVIAVIVVDSERAVFLGSGKSMLVFETITLWCLE